MLMLSDWKGGENFGISFKIPNVSVLKHDRKFINS